MENIKFKFFRKDNLFCILATMIIVGSYAAQRIIEVTVANPDKKLALILAMIYTFLLAVVLFLISKSNNSFFGILASLIGYKMMPPVVEYLAATTIEGTTLYFLVEKAAKVIFVLLIYKLYKKQEEPHEIRSLPLLAILLCVPFFSELAFGISKFVYAMTRDMLYCYFVQYACYAAAILIVLVIAYQKGCSSLRFTACFEYTALSINILRVLGKIGYFATQGAHISKSLYVWIVLYVALMVCFFVATKKKKKEIANE